ncbi:EamA family transporter [Fimbriimonas ginsengisoli]|uniref:EamA family transporter n=1 Tax=Fimbriimonas ginsengisoli TaxID=1005039 RepID=UPI000696461F|nr:DMT family transporter [Fimbriimonas ginsengisoli]
MKVGRIWVLISAAAFGTMSVLAHRGYAAGLDVPTLMLLRFGLASLALWAVVLTKREPLPRGKKLGMLLLMGVAIYFAQSYTYFAAIQHIPAAMVSLLLYLYPVIVTLFSILLFKEKLTVVRVGALALALLGTALTIGRVGHGDALGVILALVSAGLYSAYILVGSRAAAGVSPLATTAVVTGGTALSYIAYVLLKGAAPITLAGFGWGAALSIASVVAIGGLLAGLAKISPVEASVLSALEPIVTALLAAIFLGEALGTSQYAGGTLILAAVVILVRSGQKEPAR